ncbi:Ammonia transport outward protein 2 [Termitomyces sp. J132]|nr:Ammonia transport outward protein 2 [Termitomyces sp. J132]
MFAFATTTWLLSMYNVSTRGIHTPNAVVGMAVFCGGLAQFMAGMWEFPRGNVFGATVMTMYGAFWMSYATIFIPGSGIMLAYQNNTSEFNNALGIYLIVWFILTLLFIPPVARRNIANTVLLSIVAITYAMLSGAQFTGSPRLLKAGGVFGIMAGLIAFYVAESELLAAEETAFIRLPLGELA